MRSLMKNSDQYIKLKDKKSAKIHYERWLDSQLLEIEKAPDDTKMFEAVKFLKPQKTKKIACEIEEVKSHFMKKFNSEGSAVLHKISKKMRASKNLYPALKWQHPQQN